MNRGRRVFTVALLLSLAAHLLVGGNAGGWWQAPAREIPFPIEAHLVDREPPPLPDTPPPPPRRPAPAPAPAPEPPGAAAPPTPPPPVTAAPPPLQPAPTAPEAPAPEKPAMPEPAPAPPLPTATPSEAPATPRALRSLPERLTLRYSVQSGEGGFTLGQAVYTWQQREGRYNLVTVAEATGITALFVSGKLVQTSEGRVLPTGLQPEQFWLARGDKRQPPVRLDWQQKRLVMPTSSLELPPLTQDLLSFPFHLAMTVRDDDGEWRIPVTNGKKLREYDFHIVGHEPLNQGDGTLETLHLQGG